MYWIDKLIEKLYFKQPNNLALYDQLTGVYNYNWYEKIAKDKYGNEAVFITVMDINNFKQINDTKGHMFANEVLKDIGRILKLIKNYDNQAEAMRYGGDEFIIFSKKEDFAEIIKQHAKFTALVAVGSYHKDECEPMTYAIDMADKDMYEYKKKYKEEYNG